MAGPTRSPVEGDLRPPGRFLCFVCFWFLDVCSRFSLDCRHPRRPSLGGARALHESAQVSAEARSSRVPLDVGTGSPKEARVLKNRRGKARGKGWSLSSLPQAGWVAPTTLSFPVLSTCLYFFFLQSVACRCWRTMQTSQA